MAIKRLDHQQWASIISGILALASLAVAFWSNWWVKPPLKSEEISNQQFWGQIIVGLWIALPPLYFLLDWNRLPGVKDENLAHNHDLARNIWLALVLILGMLFHLKVPGSD